MVVNPSVPATTVPEFIAYGKSKPGKTTMAAKAARFPHLSQNLNGAFVAQPPERGSPSGQATTCEIGAMFR
jgi:hypothetical protein